MALCAFVPITAAGAVPAFDRIPILRRKYSTFTVQKISLPPLFVKWRDAADASRGKERGVYEYEMEALRRLTKPAERLRRDGSIQEGGILRYPAKIACSTAAFRAGIVLRPPLYRKNKK